MEVEAIEGSFYCVVVFPFAPIFCAIAMTLPPASHLAIQGRKSDYIFAGVSIDAQCRVDFDLPISVESHRCCLRGGCAATRNQSRLCVRATRGKAETKP